MKETNDGQTAKGCIPGKDHELQKRVILVSMLVFSAYTFYLGRATAPEDGISKAGYDEGYFYALEAARECEFAGGTIGNFVDLGVNEPMCLISYKHGNVLGTHFLYYRDGAFEDLKEWQEKESLYRAQNDCKTEGGEWWLMKTFGYPSPPGSDKWSLEEKRAYDAQQGIKANAYGCKIGEEKFPFLDHQLQGFEEWKELKEAKKVCSNHEGKWHASKTIVKGGENLQYVMSQSSGEPYWCEVKDKTYRFENGQLIHHGENEILK